MKEDEIRRLIKIVEESNIGELEISRWGQTIRISKSVSNSGYGTNSNAVQTLSPPPAHAETAVAGEKKEEAGGEAKALAASNAVEVKSPMVGTFYRAPAPDADPYVEVNQKVTKGQVLCIIEAMKLMNEIESEYDGRIVDILVENAQPVEYNQPLFLIEPA
ncbi:MAG: acetyl-CoA carboxylase biotin carboxyl carrier protein [Calditrichaeota bacterium]|nr:MAG: acetyl-CoA carboxylase biotin carboxyl carrier protein [Calditrichota bacterium]